jgi:hypothetical protein
MNKRGLILLFLFIVAVVAAILFAQSQPEYSDTDRKSAIVFGVFYILIVIVMFAAFGRSSTEGFLFLPRSAWAIFASFSVAFAALMFLSVISMPWLGHWGFDFMFGKWSWLVLPGLAAVVYPVVRRRLL